MANGVEPSSAPALLSVDNLNAGYGKIRALHGVSLRVPQARIVCVLGANGAGKTTLMRALSGLLPVSDGQAIFDGQSTANVPAETLVRRGIAHVPQGRMVFAQLTVRGCEALSAIDSGRARKLLQAFGAGRWHRRDGAA